MTTKSEKEAWHVVITPDERILWLGWGIEKNQILMRERGVSFEQVLLAVQEEGIAALAYDSRPGHAHRQQWLLEVTINGYTHVCPCRLIEGRYHEPALFLKTCYPSRKAQRRS